MLPSVSETRDLDIWSAIIGGVGDPGVEAPRGRVGAVVGVIESLLEVVDAGQHLIDEPGRPDAVPDGVEVVLPARHHLIVLLQNRSGIRGRLAARQFLAQALVGAVLGSLVIFLKVVLH